MIKIKFSIKIYKIDDFCQLFLPIRFDSQKDSTNSRLCEAQSKLKMCIYLNLTKTT